MMQKLEFKLIWKLNYRLKIQVSKGSAKLKIQVSKANAELLHQLVLNPFKHPQTNPALNLRLLNNS